MYSSFGYNGGITAPQKTATLAGYDILKDGGTAIEAMVAAAATIAVTYPHMNGVGGDAFWLIKKDNQEPIGISGCGSAAANSSIDWYEERGISEQIPSRGGLSCVTVPGAVASWAKALSLVAKPMSILDLLSNSIAYAKNGFSVTANQSECSISKCQELKEINGFSQAFLVNKLAPETGFLLKQKALQRTLETLVNDGLKSFYHGEIGDLHAKYLSSNGSPLSFNDFKNFDAEFVKPINAKISKGQLYNLPAPTQGISSIMILALYDKLKNLNVDSFEHIHALIEITKRVFIQRNRELGDPKYMTCSERNWLKDDVLNSILNGIDFSSSMPWPYCPKKGDTIWMGAIDKEGTAVSFIQSLFWEFGSGLVCPETGVCFQNRGASFSLKTGPNKLLPGKKPFHTLNPALAILKDGRRMVYGTMGGDGQPQTQSAIFSRYVYFNHNLQQSISLPRWLLGKTWGETGTSLKLETRFEEQIVKKLKLIGHEVEMLTDYSDLVGHAGALVLNHKGLIEGAFDPRSDGSALVF